MSAPAKRPREEEEETEQAIAVTSPTLTTSIQRSESPIAATAAMTKRELKFEGRSMPSGFQDQLGEGALVIPDEAKDIEDVVHGHTDFEDLPEARRKAIFQTVKRLNDRAVKFAQQAVKDELTAEQVEAEVVRMVMRHSRLQGQQETAKKSEMTAAYRALVRDGGIALPNPLLEQCMIRKKGKSHSGVLVVTVFMGPGEFSCPKDCYYCPNQPGIARSYLLKEPGVLRGFRNSWDPIRQFYDRASALENNGHVVDKIELIILGGTFSFYPKPYVEDFIRASFYAANTYYDSAPLRPMVTLAEELHLNETAKCRIIGVTAETRPDYISQSELRRFRTLGITRVQLGIQHLDDDVLNLINRECPTAKTVVAIERLLNAGFKVDAHWMPDLPGSSFKKDMEMFQQLFSEENVSFQVDQWKVYPTATVPFTKIKEWYEEGRYKPYAEEEGGRFMVELLIYIMQTCPERIRLNRIIRDIPTTYIMGGEKRCNLRQVIEAEMKAKGIRCKDIRERECKGAPINRSDAKLFVDKFRASNGTEYYISLENGTRTSLYGHLRLRIRDDSSINNSILPALENAALIRELHTYGKLVAVSKSNSGKETQHVGVGTELMKHAEDIAKEHGYSRTAVIAGVGVRKYYEKLGYRLMDTYMVKDFAEEAAVTITEDLIVADDDNDVEGSQASSFGVGVLGAVSQTLNLWASVASKAVGGVLQAAFRSGDDSL